MEITDLEIDDGNEPHLTRHRSSIAEIYQLFVNRPLVRRNRAGRTATHVAVGKTDGGRALVVPFVLPAQPHDQSQRGRGADHERLRHL